MQAVILVGGFGTRLRPLTRDVPKQMLPVVDRPMIEHVVAHLAAHGVTRVVLSLGFRPEAFSDAYPDGTCAGLPLHYAVEPEPLDTAGAVRFAALEAGIRATRGSGIGTGRGTDRATVSGSGSSSRDRTGSDHGGSDAFLVLNGDVLTDLRSEEHTSELQSRTNLVCRLLLEKKKHTKKKKKMTRITHETSW